MKKLLPKILKLFLLLTALTIGALLIILVSNYYFESRLNPKDIQLGVTLSTHYTKSFNHDPYKLLTEIVTDLKITKIRLPVYWSEVERSPGKFDFSEYDRLLAYDE